MDAGNDKSQMSKKATSAKASKTVFLKVKSDFFICELPYWFSIVL